MNVPRAIELAFAQLLRARAALGEKTVVRAWQSLANDAAWDSNKDRSFPIVDVRCSPPRTDTDEGLFICECALLCGTKTDDDKSHAAVAAIYGEVQAVADSLYSQFRNAEAAELAEFKAVLTADLGAAFHFGGLTWGDGMAPYDDGGVNMIGLAMRVHYSRTDI